jgi:hypothetical protein
VDAPPMNRSRLWPVAWRVAFGILVLVLGMRKHADDVRARAADMRAGAETNARLEELRGQMRTGER